ncbi:SDR family NAD(P)-dependent oxidoreductase [Belnapia rosea]|uniref:SDR family NAD(P)-dependent oxidoreductase n=1 Tax=Belnapia rosea TaxID=938405 RepID=UPI00088AB92D|nr:SDR family NAD(P)-dependent oxidoreductase [Belnapia rosea]SDB74499.1 3-hydroxybutyrate dehydrogenase [Belnapia rosea]
MVPITATQDGSGRGALRGRTALITGSTGGIGLAVALALAAEGCDILLHGLATDEEAAPALAAVERLGVQAWYHRVELADPAAIAALVAEAGAPDILVNNATARHFGPVEDTPPDAWDADIAVNLTAAFHLVRLSLPGMRRRGWGRVLNMSSIYGLVGATGRIGYVTTKTALIGLTRAVALETAESGITCNALCPGSTLTPNIDGRIRAAMAEGGLDRAAAEATFLAGKQPTGRFVQAEAVGAMAAFLCGEAGRDITGAVLPIDGGWSAA